MEYSRTNDELHKAVGQDRSNRDSNEFLLVAPVGDIWGPKGQRWHWNEDSVALTTSEREHLEATEGNESRVRGDLERTHSMCNNETTTVVMSRMGFLWTYLRQ